MMFFKLCTFSMLLLSCIFENIGADNAKVSCKDEEGQNVDWFYLYKLPKNYNNNKNEAETMISDENETGFQYLYLTSRNSEKWQLSKALITESNSITAITLDPIFADQTVLLMAYNDEYPNGTTVVGGGHTKGVVATDTNTGIWMIHSVPKFPSIPSYEYPSTGAHYGQSFLCISLPAEEMEKVGAQLLYNEPNVYYTRLPVMLSEKYPNLEKVMEGGKQNVRAPFQNILDITSIDGKIFKVFAKSGKFGGDLYEDLIAPTLNVNLMVQTWRNGAGNMPSNCTKNDKVYNIAKISSKDLKINFKTTNDHSKWAVSKRFMGVKFWRWFSASSEWICIGDINRQHHQLERGGGTVCQKSRKIANLYRNLIADYEPCQQ